MPRFANIAAKRLVANHTIFPGSLFPSRVTHTTNFTIFYFQFVLSGATSHAYYPSSFFVVRMVFASPGLAPDAFVVSRRRFRNGQTAQFATSLQIFSEVLKAIGARRELGRRRRRKQKRWFLVGRFASYRRVRFHKVLQTSSLFGSGRGFVCGFF